MLHCLRRADELSAAAYPLETGAPAPWRRDGEQHRCELPLPACPEGHIIVPSLAVAGADARYRFTLRHGADRVPLHPVPAAPGDVEPASSGATDAGPPTRAACSEIDCWHTLTPLDGATVEVTLTGADPARHLLVISVRPLTLDVEPPLGATVVAPAPRGVSQMSAEPAIASRICSPTALAMATDAAAWPRLVEECYDPATRMYGVWPYAIRAAARCGRLGAVEAFADWDAALRSLAAGVRPVASIRFGAGELDGAPMARTGGHLVVLYGVEDGYALVADPAAPTAESVLRRYPLAQFSRAWLAYRGAAYIVPT